MSKSKKTVANTNSLPPSLDRLLNYPLGSNAENHALEKEMLENPMIMDATEGFALQGDTRKSRQVVEEINGAIAKKTSESSDRVYYRIAAFLVVLFLISGGSFYLFNQLTINSNALEDNKGGSLETNGTAAHTSPIAPSDSGKEIAVVASELPNSPTANSVIKSSTNSGKEIKSDQDELPRLRSEEANLALSEVIQPSSKEEEVPNNSGPEFKERIWEDITLSKEDSRGASQKKMANAPFPSSSKMEQSPSMDLFSEDKKKKATSYLLSDGIAFYQQGKYLEAEKILAGVLVTQPNNQEALFYEGMACFHLKRLDSALQPLGAIKAGNRHYDEARWTKALIYLEKDNKDEAVRLLKILSMPGNLYSEKAIEELLKIKE